MSFGFGPKPNLPCYLPLGFNGLVTSVASLFDWVGWPTGEKATSIPLPLPDPLDDVEFFFFFFG